MAIVIREANETDFDAIWDIFHPIVKAGTTYAFNPHISKEDAFDLWMNKPRQTFVAEEEGHILGTYYINANYAGPGGHVANCGYMVGKKAQGKGIATKIRPLRNYGFRVYSIPAIICLKLVSDFRGRIYGYFHA